MYFCILLFYLDYSRLCELCSYEYMFLQALSVTTMSPGILYPNNVENVESS